MSTHVAVRVSYPERGDYNWYEALTAYAEVGCVEVAFYQPELFLSRVQVEKVLAPFSTLPLRATSVHMARPALPSSMLSWPCCARPLPSPRGWDE